MFVVCQYPIATGAYITFGRYLFVNVLDGKYRAHTNVFKCVQMAHTNVFKCLWFGSVGLEMQRIFAPIMLILKHMICYITNYIFSKIRTIKIKHLYVVLIIYDAYYMHKAGSEARGIEGAKILSLFNIEYKRILNANTIDIVERDLDLVVDVFFLLQIYSSSKKILVKLDMLLGCNSIIILKKNIIRVKNYDLQLGKKHELEITGEITEISNSGKELQHFALHVNIEWNRLDTIDASNHYYFIILLII
ncbi:hypothetical protein ACJX0J_028466 [Zea mays]